jgi:hypothetical protein
MLVYGDPKFVRPLNSLVEKFGRRIAHTNATSLDDLRILVIQAGQLEQAVIDGVAKHALPGQLRIALEHLTDCVAAEFCREWNGSGAVAFEFVNRAFEEVRRVMKQDSIAANAVVTTKVPEGFAFYALFPEQYCVAVRTWADQHLDCGEVLVVGIRSIGTSLSAVVKETLSAAGFQVRRITVHPTGPVFQRRLELDLVSRAKQILVVDEGPGISGSSMAAVARAFGAAGVREVSFLPGHAGEPGKAGSSEVRDIWKRTPRFVTSIDRVRWDGLSLQQSFAAKAQELDGGDPFETVNDLSVGQWRKYAFSDEEDWPATAVQFERMKFLCRRRGGASVLWKFAGLHCNENGQSECEAAWEQLSARARAGFGPAPLGMFRGFIATPWVEGTRLAREDADRPMLKRIGDYIVQAAGAPLSPEEHDGAVTRLAEMLYWNTKEALGESIAEQTRSFVDAARENVIPFSYGDGHLAPHEWIRTSRGLIFKLDCEGHANDHTVVGRQSLLWDVAGTLVEWDLNSANAATFFQGIEEGGVRIDFDALAFYLLAYSAFRLGLISMSLDQTSDAAERSRLSCARDFYADNISLSLKAEVAPAQNEN